ncbi:MAG: 2OG-Fe(II) oxygenase, partial [Myxococcales bacterium]|nr:2OG-Fe(II) oxygenase [Myxococcales bacterium]
SPFGYRDETRFDAAVRDSFEIAGARVRLDPRAWSLRFARGLREVSEALGLASDVDVRAALHKLVIYGEGQFFAAHRDSGRHPSMRATLVVILPSAYEGGELVVTHAEQSVTYDTAAERRDQVLFIGFYADCVHAIRPVRSGYRVALTYGLHVGGADGAVDLPARDQSYPDLHNALGDYFGDPSAPRSPWLVYLFDHQYAAQSLGWDGLKGGDRDRADALRTVADELGCDCFLALADVHEWYEIDEEDAESGAEIPPEGYGPRLGLELNLERWMNADGEPCNGSDMSADDREVVSTFDALQRAAYERSYEAWTGNEGGSAEQWYHQAALVVVPRGTELHAEIVAAPAGAAEDASVAEALTPPRAVIVRTRRR